MPLVRRFMHKLAGKDFVTVQAMSQPTGLVFFIDHQFGTTRKGFDKGESLYGTTFSGTRGEFDYVMDTNLEKGLYDAGRWGYSLNEATTVSTVTACSTSTIITAKYYQNDSRFSQSYADEIADGDIKLLSVAIPTDADKNGYDAFYLYNSETDTSSATYI
jgi:hypothetical protein